MFPDLCVIYLYYSQRVYLFLGLDVCIHVHLDSFIETVREKFFFIKFPILDNFLVG